MLVCGGAVAALVGGLAVFAMRSDTATDDGLRVPSCILVAPEPVEAPAAVAPKPVYDPQVKLVFTAGGASYIKLADVGNRAAETQAEVQGDVDDLARAGDQGSGLAMPRHGAITHVEDDYAHGAIAPVALRDVPQLYASWLGRSFRIDGHCEASIVGFAVVARLSGDPSYAGVDDWSAANVMKAGAPVLAAKLDGCTGSLARDASLPAIVFPDKLQDAALEQAARDAMLGSALAAETQRDWDVQVKNYGATPGKWTVDAEITTQVLRHPRTGETFVSAQAQVSTVCGAPDANLWMLYRVTEHGLVPVHQRKLTALQTIDQLVDIDGDGDFELVGHPWLNNEQLVTRSTGETLESFATPYFGCPC